MSIFWLFICSLCLYEWFLFVHNLNRIVNFWDLFLVEIYRKIKVNFYLLCLNYEQIKTTHINIMSKSTIKIYTIPNDFGVKFVKIYPEMTSQYFIWKNMVLVDYIGIFLHVAILLATYCRQWNEKQTIKYHTVKTIPKSNIKFLERGTIDTPNAQIHDCSLFWLTCE